MSHQSQQIFLQIVLFVHIEIHESQLFTTITSSKVVHSCIVTRNIYIVSSVKKLVWGNLIHYFVLVKSSIQTLKVTTPNFNCFLEPTTTDSCLKCNLTNHKSLYLILETPLLGTLKIHSLFIWCPKNAFYENLESPIDYQQNSTKSFSIQ